MKLITATSELKTIFKKLLVSYNEYYFATAWAGTPATIIDELFKRKQRIKEFIVGIHFFQSDPAFFEKFVGNNNVKVILQPDGTFHPKIFLFYNNDFDWKLLVGSANFTNGGFNNNTEVVSMIDGNKNSIEILTKAKQFINENWKNGNIISDDFLRIYRLKHEQMKTRKENQSIYNGKESFAFTKISKFMEMSWQEYSALFNQHRKRVERRFFLLETVRKIFATGRSMRNMSEDERRLIGGIKNNLSEPGYEDYASFGNSGNGKYLNKIISGNRFFSDALDAIPLNGEVLKEHFDEFLFNFYKDPDASKGWVSSAGRLLTMKRPDFFYNITSENRGPFSAKFKIGISSTMTLDNYWAIISDRIHISTWYNDFSPKNEFERKLANARSAMLDVLFYNSQ